MPKVHLTKRAVDQLKAPTPSGKQVLHWDASLKGFGILCSGVSDKKTYVVQRDIEGRTRRITIAPVNVLPLEEARRRAEIVLGEFYRGVDPKAARRGAWTLGTALDAYLAARHGLRAKSVEDYRSVVNSYLGAWIDRPLREITGEMLEARHRSLQAEVAARGRHAGKATANNTMRAFGALYSFVAEREAMPPNPVTRLKRQWFKVHRRERHVRAEQLPEFYRAVLALPNPVQRDYILLLLFTGLRRTEAATLTWDDVDLVGGTIRIPATRTKAGRKLDLPMTDIVRDLLIARRAVGMDRYVFPSTGNGHISEPKFPLAVVANATGIRVSAHDLRRTYVTVAESADISPMALKLLVNHSTGSDVTAGYVQVSATRIRLAAQRVANELKLLCQIARAEGAVPLRR